MAKYRALAQLAIGGRLIEAGELIADDGTAGYTPIPSGYVPSPACDPLDASGIAALTAAMVQLPQPNGDSGILGVWGIRPTWNGYFIPRPSAAWRAIVHT